MSSYSEKEMMRLVDMRKQVTRLYKILEDFGIHTNYEGSIERQGDQVFVRGEVRLFGGLNQGTTVLITDSTKYDSIFVRKVFDSIDWINIEYFAAAICKDKFLWGYK